MKKFTLSDIWKHPVFRHLVAAFVLVLVLSQVVLIWLKFYTGHNDSSPVPDFTGMPLEEASAVIAQEKLRYQVIDSVYTPGAQAGAVIQQNPHPGAHVKENRTIFFTINARMPEKVMMPDLRGATLRLASSRLSAFGLRQGRLEYRNDMAVNSVLSQRYLGREIAPGTRVPKGASIDLVVGKGLSAEMVPVPALAGLSPAAARDSLEMNMLSVGTMVGDETLSGVLSHPDARVWQQRPAQGSSLSIGGSVDLWLTLDASKLP